MAMNSNSRSVDLDKVTKIALNPENIHAPCFDNNSNVNYFATTTNIDMDNSTRRYSSNLQTGTQSDNGSIHGLLYVRIDFIFDGKCSNKQNSTAF